MPTKSAPRLSRRQAGGLAGHAAKAAATSEAAGRSRQAGGAKAGRAAKPKGPAGLTVTLAYADGEWTVAATRAARRWRSRT